LNGGLHAVSVGKPSERMSNFWTVRFLKTESNPNFGFPHISMCPYYYRCSYVVGGIGELWPYGQMDGAVFGMDATLSQCYIML